MYSKSAKAILVVSFGTSYEKTREASIEAIENHIRDVFPDYRVYRAWTSRMIIRKLKTRDHIHVDTISEALDRILADGITQIIVQPTHMINGLENEAMIKEILLKKDAFSSVHFGAPLLSTDSDLNTVIQILTEAFAPLEKNRMVVFMGHGTAHHADFVYGALNFRFRDMGYDQFLIGTVEGYPDMNSILRSLRKSSPQKILLAPFMIVAGDHANNDMAGEGKDSWMNILKKEGYQVDVVLKGLGEYPQIQEMFAEHIRSAIQVTP